MMTSHSAFESDFSSVACVATAFQLQMEKRLSFRLEEFLVIRYIKERMRHRLSLIKQAN